MPKLSDVFLSLLGDSLMGAGGINPVEERQKQQQFQQKQALEQQNADTARLTGLAHFGTAFDTGGAQANVPGIGTIPLKPALSQVPTFTQDANGNITPGPTITAPHGVHPIITKPTAAAGGGKHQLRQNAFTGDWEWYQPPASTPTLGSPDGGPPAPNGSPSNQPPSGRPTLPFRDQAKLDKEKPKAFAALQNTQREYDNMIKEAEAIRDDPSLSYATGLAAPLGNVPGTGAKRVSARMETLKAKTLLNVLSSMKQLSSTGASGFGQLSNIEGENIRNSISTLDTKQSKGDLQESINRFIREMKARKDNLQGTFEDTYGPMGKSNMPIQNNSTGSEREKFIQGALQKGYSQLEAEGLATQNGLQ